MSKFREFDFKNLLGIFTLTKYIIKTNINNLVNINKKKLNKFLKELL